MEDGLGYERYAVQGGDWGASIAARMAFDSPATVAGRPRQRGLGPAGSGRPRRPAAERGRAGLRRDRLALAPPRGLPPVRCSRRRPDAVGGRPSTTRPAGLAAWLVEKYRRWSDCDGEVERRFSKDQLCDFLTMYWATGTIASSMRLYLGERRDRWRLGAGRADRGPGRGRRLPRRDRPAAARVGGADLRRPAPLDRDAARRPLRRLRGARAAGRRRDRVPGRPLTPWASSSERKARPPPERPGAYDRLDTARLGF